MKWWSVIVFFMAVASTIGLAYVSAQLEIVGDDTGQVINIRDATNTSTSSSGGGNVTSVSSANAFLVVSPTTGDVIITAYNMTPSPFFYNQTNSPYYYNQTQSPLFYNQTQSPLFYNQTQSPFYYNQTGANEYNHTAVTSNGNITQWGKHYFNATAGNIPVSISAPLSGGLATKLLSFSVAGQESFWIGKHVAGAYDGIVLPNTAGQFFFGIGTDDLSIVKQFILFNSGSTGFNTITGVPYDFAVNQSNRFRMWNDKIQLDNDRDGTVGEGGEGDINWSIIGTTRLGGSNWTVDNDLSVLRSLNVTINATIPHDVRNLTNNKGFNANYTNGAQKVIRVNANIFFTLDVAGDGSSYGRIILNPYNDPRPKFVKLCGVERTEEVGSATANYHYQLCSFAVPIGYNWTIYSVVSGTGSISLREVEITDE